NAFTPEVVNHWLPSFFVVVPTMVRSDFFWVVPIHEDIVTERLPIPLFSCLPPLPIGLEGRAPVALHASCAERQPPGCLVVFESTRLRGPAHPSCHRTSCPSPGQQPPQRQPPPWKARGRRPDRTPGTSRHRYAGRPSRPSRRGTCQS